MALLTNVIDKINKETDARLVGKIVTTWRDGSAMSDALCGALYSKDLLTQVTDENGDLVANPTYGQYFKKSIEGDHFLSVLNISTQANFVKLLNDLSTNKKVIVIDRLLSISSALIIPANIILRVLDGCGFSYPTGVAITVLGSIEAGNYQIFFHSGGGANGTVDISFKDVKVDWFGGNSGTPTGNKRAFDQSKNAITSISGGRMRISRGTKVMSSSISRIPNLSLISGAGMNSTIITGDGSSEFAFDIDAPTRVGQGPTNDASAVYTFTESNAVRGAAYVNLKDINWATEFTVGQLIYIKNGANYGDQDFGEMLEISAIVGARLYFKRHLGRSYTQALVRAWWATTADFVQPAIDANVTVAFTSLTSATPPEDKAITIGDNIYIVQSANSTSAVIKNIGRGNSVAGTVIASGSKLSVGRYLFKINISNKLTIQDLTILAPTVGIVRLFRLDNAYEITVKRVRIEVPAGSLSNQNLSTFFADNAHLCIFDRCEFYSRFAIFGSQVSRSCGNLIFKNSGFYNLRLDCSEFSFNTQFDNCEMHFHIKAGESVSQYIVNGASTSGLSIRNSKIWVSGGVPLFNDNEIAGYLVNDSSHMEFEGNTIYANLASNILPSRSVGKTIVRNNKIFGSIGLIMYSVRSMDSNRQSYNYENICEDNVFFLNGVSDVTAGNPLILIAGNASIKNNKFEFKMPDGFDISAYDKPIIEISGSLPANAKVVIANNTFNGMPLKANHILYTGIDPRDSRLSIYNNEYSNSIVDTTGTVIPNFNLTLRNGDNYGDARSLAGMQKNADLDYKIFMDAEYKKGSILSTSQRAAVKKFIDYVYALGLRDTAVYINPVLGSGTTPLWGWDISGARHDIGTHREGFMKGGLTSADYSDLVGLQGATGGGGKRMIFARQIDIDCLNMCMSVQITNAGIADTKIYIGCGSGTRMYKSGTNLYGLGGVAIKSSFTNSVGFLLTGKLTIEADTAQSKGLNMLDTVSHPNQSNTNKLGTITNTSSPSSKFTLFTQGDISTTSGDDGIGGFGLYTFMSLRQAKMWRTIWNILMIDLGRPSQGAPIMSDLDLNVIDTAATVPSKSVLNSTYPYPEFKKDDYILFPNANAQAVKLDNAADGNWNILPYNPAI